jgi:hypothetical protein
MRALIIALLTANLAFWAWTQGALDALLGASPHGDREPQRLQRQLNAERLRIVRALPDTASMPAAPALPAAAATTAAASVPAADGACFEAGPFSPTELVAAEAALVRAALPGGSWSDVRVDRPGAWIVYVGRFATREQMTQREEELRRQGINASPVRNAPDLEPGLSLGRFEDRNAADGALAALAQRGVVRNARVLTVTAPSTVHLLRVERADASVQAQLTSLRAPALGAGFVRCGQGGASQAAR